MATKTFTTGEVLTAADTNTYLANSGLVYITQVYLSSGTSSITVSNCFSSTYNSYRVVSNFTRDGASSAYAFLRMGPAIDHYFSGEQSIWNSPTRTGDNGNDGYLFITSGGTTSITGTNSFTTEIHAPNLARYSYMHTEGAGYSYRTRGDIQVANTTQHTGFTFSLGSGNFTGGFLTVYGYRN
jgi:hypothetical protein